MIFDDVSLREEPGCVKWLRIRRFVSLLVHCVVCFSRFSHSSSLSRNYEYVPNVVLICYYVLPPQYDSACYRPLCCLGNSDGVLL